MMHLRLLACLLLPIGCLTGLPAAAQEESAKQQKPADKQLLDDLESDLLKDLPPAKAAAGKSKAPSKADRKLQDELDRGEDVGSEPEDPLVRIGRQMRSVEERISQKDTSEETQSLQREVVDELDKLIRQARQQGSGGKSGSGAGTGQAGAGTGEARPGAAQESTDRVGKPQTDASETADVRDVLRRIWGHLPEKMRDEMQTALGDRFLPKYEKLIEEYYKRLAEERSGGP